MSELLSELGGDIAFEMRSFDRRWSIKKELIRIKRTITLQP